MRHSAPQRRAEPQETLSIPHLPHLSGEESQCTYSRTDARDVRLKDRATGSRRWKLDPDTQQRVFSLLARQAESLNHAKDFLSDLTPSQVHYLQMQCERFILTAQSVRLQMLSDAARRRIG